MTSQTANKLLKKQRKYFYEGHTFPASFRKNALLSLRNEIKKRENDIIEAVHKDLGKSEFEAYTNEIGILYLEIKHILKNLSKWMKPVKAKLELHLLPGSGRIYSEPFGNTLIIAPWNYPFQLMMAPLIAAISAGNTAIIKPSEYAVNTSQIISEIIKSIYNEEFVAVVNGGVDVTKNLLKLDVDKIFFTGSVPVGKIVMKAASENLTSVTLELGGKSPAIIDKSANLKSAAKKIAWAKFNNAGQTCVAPDYVLIDETVKDSFLCQLRDALIDFYGETPQQSKDYGRIVNEGHFSRIVGLIDNEKVYYGGQSDRESLYIAPTIMTDVSVRDKVMEDEIFGPVLPVLSFNTLQEAVGIIRSYTKPLALYVFTKDKSVEKFFVERVSFGGGGINTALLHVASSTLPFGGVGHSGTGRYHGKWGFEEFSHKKSILKQPSFYDPGVAYPGSQLPLKWIKRIVG
ncbi:aldehyde dehydrogenase [Chitinispirillales bacterium ANBcel5]|uniref:aldehyde dehydrogenase n=1 Tax=Cellulosispirillum alkaliphilum TaxID=3039283 RepID=UPI002A56C470|nr:aldehyde dehydrogenase [Chitinispirillales bacterium ANBcel5]